ncbi:12916_t:CDS:2, partial [Rhizophagus irregularis]
TKKYMNENYDNLPLSKRQKKAEALQELVYIRPDLKRKTLYFFHKYFEGMFIYDAKEKKAYVYSIKDDHKFDSFFKWINWLKNQGYFKEKRSAIATIFLKSNFTSLSIASILHTDYTLYWKATSLINTMDILSIQEKVLPEGEFTGIAVQKIIGGLEFNFFRKYEVYVFDQLVQEKYLSVSVKEIERILNEIINFIKYIFAVSICHHGMSTSGNIFLN